MNAVFQYLDCQQEATHLDNIRFIPLPLGVYLRLLRSSHVIVPAVNMSRIYLASETCLAFVATVYAFVTLTDTDTVIAFDYATFRAGW